MSTVKDHLQKAAAAVLLMANCYAHRESTDALGRMDQALADVQDVFDEFPDSSVIDRDQAERLDEALTDLAALALAQVALLRNEHPFLAGESA